MARAAKGAEPPRDLTDLLKQFPFELAVVPIDRIHPNTYNPNVMDDLTRQATRDSIAMFGFIDPPTVRKHPNIDGHYELIDGEHRIAEARELGVAEIPVIILDIDTPTAMKLTVVLNQRGHNDDVRLGALLGELQASGAQDWSKALAFDTSTLQHLIDLGKQDWTPPEGAGGVGVGAGGGGPVTEWVTIEALIPREVLGVLEAARDRAGELGELTPNDNAKIATGQLLEVLAASYLAALTDTPADAG